MTKNDNNKNTTVDNLNAIIKAKVSFNTKVLNLHNFNIYNVAINFTDKDNNKVLNKEFLTHFTECTDRLSKSEETETIFNSSAINNFSSMACNKKLQSQLLIDSIKDKETITIEYVAKFLKKYGVDSQNTLRALCYTEGKFGSKPSGKTPKQIIQAKKDAKANNRKPKTKGDIVDNKTVTEITDETINKFYSTTLKNCVRIKDSDKKATLVKLATCLDAIIKGKPELLAIHSKNYKISL